ncbi:hypothetical protein ACIQOU_16740 [Streptomyces sp. NPDC091279]|uniref:hypothetical protein n=1 Tax=unclassified Streptomyces TaxID=2593676 RepID=UPI0038014652
MRHCNTVGRPPRDALIRHLLAAGEDPTDLSPPEYDEAVCELAAGHPHDHAYYLTEINPTTQLWVRWDGEQFTFPLLPLCTGTGPRPDDVCHLFADHPPGHSWQLGR